jgi:hypothetical protein
MTLPDPVERNNSFSKKTPFLQIYWDSTSLGLLKECPRKYFFRMIEGWHPKKMAAPLRFGIIYHEVMERYAHHIANGTSHEDAMRLVVRHALEQTVDRIEIEDEDDPNNNRIECVEWQPDDKNRTRQNMIRTIVWYLEEHKDDPAETVILKNGKPAVELSFKFFSGHRSLEGEPFYLSGHIDKVVRFGELLYVMDYKTTGYTLAKNFFDKFTPDNQMSTYTIAGKIVIGEEVAGVIIDAAQLAVNFSRFGRGFAPRTPAQDDEWLEELEHWFGIAQACAANRSWPMNDKSCSMYGGCEFRHICSKDPAVREVFLTADFEKKVWDPTVSRGL